MTVRTRKVKPAPQETKEVEQPQPQADKSAEDLKAEMDAMLDEIDSVLEENAEEFVKHYIQKGGQ